MQWTAHGRPGLRRDQAGGRRGRGCIYACAERGGGAPSKMRTLLISLEMENSSTHAMRAAEARDTVCGARLEGSTRPEHAENSERDISLRDVGVPGILISKFWGDIDGTPTPTSSNGTQRYRVASSSAFTSTELKSQMQVNPAQHALKCECCK